VSSTDSQFSDNIIEKCGPMSQTARARGNEKGYSSLVGVSRPVYAPLRPGQPTFLERFTKFQ